MNADHDVMLGVARRGARGEKNCERGDEKVPRDDVDLCVPGLTHDQIGRILVQLQ